MGSLKVHFKIKPYHFLHTWQQMRLKKCVYLQLPGAITMNYTKIVHRCNAAAHFPNKSIM